MGKNKSYNPLVSIVLLNWNGLEDTKICLKEISKQTYKNIEIIVVDNGSTDGSAEFLKNQSDIILVLNKFNKGFTGGHIDGLKHAKGQYILILNNDAVMKSDLIEKSLESFNSDNNIAVVGGRAYFWNKDNELLDESNDFYSYQRMDPHSAEGIFYQKDYNVTEEVNVVSGSCAMIKKSVIDEVGYLNDRFFAYYEESDLFARIKRAGHKVVYNPEVRIWHKVGASSEKKSSSFMYYMLFRNRFFFAIHNFESSYLKYFLINYSVFGIKSILKYLLRRGDQNINQPFARAFLYNLFHFPVSFRERKKLKNQLGNSNYNTQIITEQINACHIITVHTSKQLKDAIKASEILRPSHELLIIVDGIDIDINHAKNYPGNVRFVHDKAYFNTHSENIGVITSRYDWVVFSSIQSMETEGYMQYIDSGLTRLIKDQKECIVPDINQKDHVSILKSSVSLPYIVKRCLVLEAGGLQRHFSVIGSLSLLSLYASMKKSIIYSHEKYGFHVTDTKNEVFTDDDIRDAIRLTQEQLHANLRKPKPKFYDPVMKRFYRLQQLSNLLSWLISKNIKLKLKMARLKNLLLYSVTFNKKLLGIELKHIRNEILLSNGSVRDLSKQKIVSENAYRRQFKNPEDTAVFIICRDRLTPLIELLEWLKATGLWRIVLIDNDSAYPELTNYLQNTEYQVLDMKRNAGHTVAWQQYIIPILVPDEYYIVTDPDVIPTSQPNIRTIKQLYATHDAFPDHLKVGFGLKIDDLPDVYSLKNEVIQWEGQFWKKPLVDGVFEAGVDTTFALYKPFVYDYIIHPSLRLGEPYTARHLPWYSDDSNLSQEDIFYRIHADQNVNTWNKGALPDRYIKELKKLNKTR